MPVSRRDLIRNSAIGAGVLAVGNVSTLLGSPTAHAQPLARGAGAGSGPFTSGYGDLIPDPAGILDLPVGFKYRIISTEGNPMGNGAGAPGRFDGTGAFAGPKRSVALVRNAEQGGSADFPTTAGTDPAFVWDPSSAGGTSTVVLDKHGNKVSEYTSLAGTYNNCAGGVTPWGTWLTCEESETIRTANGVEYRHGYVFEVDPWNIEHNEQPTPLTALGRFAHEAAVVDPATLDVYLTEDASGPFGLVYKAELDHPSAAYGGLRGGGALFAMACTEGGAHVPNLHAYAEIGHTLDVSWVPVPDAQAATVSIRKQFTDDQVTRSQKFEGMWWADGRAHIVVSFANGAHDGQVWSLDPAAGTLTLEVRYEVSANGAGLDDSVPDQPDNIAISPWGGMLLCEDSGGGQHMLAVAPDGSTSLFGYNRRDAASLGASEFTGVCFSPDRHTMFCNFQAPGVTFAVTGPFARIRRNG